MNSIFNKIRNNEIDVEEIATTKPDEDGYIWLTMLIKFNYKNGKSEIVKSFSRPAKESSIKSIKKEKKKSGTKIVDYSNIKNEEIELF